jgi:hypothetical protein
MTRLERDNEKKLVDEMKMKNEDQPQGEYVREDLHGTGKWWK